MKGINLTLEQDPLITTCSIECVCAQIGWIRGRWIGWERKIKEILWNLRRAVILTTDKEKGGQKSYKGCIYSITLSQLEPRSSPETRWQFPLGSRLWGAIVPRVFQLLTAATLTTCVITHSPGGVPGLSAGWFSRRISQVVAVTCVGYYFDWNCPEEFVIPPPPPAFSRCLSS